MKINTSLLDKKEKYIIGVSGGVDSMSLLDMLQKQGYQLFVCHINYHLRHDSDIDQKLVDSYCKKFNIPFFCKEVSKSEYQGENFQMEARNIRYTFYRDIGLQQKINKVILGHHLDDVIETIYMQLERNATKGYLGIQDTSMVMGLEIYRPLLLESKQALYAYCTMHGVKYHEDYTNFQTEFTRDYVRNVALKEYTPQQKRELLQYATNHNERYRYRNKKTQAYIERYRKQKYLKYSEVPKQYVSDIIYQMIKEVVYPPYISNTLINEVIKQLESNKPNIEVTLPLNIVFIKEYDNIYVSKDKRIQGYCLKYPYLVYDKHDYFYLSKEGHINEGVYLEDADFPITIRTHRPGDVIFTNSGTKKLSRLFIDNKIPKRLRQVWPIVENSDGTIVLVPNIAKNNRYLSTKPNVFVIKYKNLGE